MNIIIEREKDNGLVIDGVLKINGETICHTAENSNNAILAGNYNIHICHCKQYGRRMPMVDLALDSLPKSNECDLCEQKEYVSINTNLPSYCPMLKAGNGAYNRTDGSIIVGEYVAPGCLIHPVIYFEKIFERIRKALSRNSECRIIIR